MDEEEKNKQGEKETTDDKDAGDKSELSKETELANTAAERMEQATEELKAAEAKARLGGIAVAGQPREKPKRLSDVEYAEKFDKGEVDPFKEDGYI